MVIKLYFNNNNTIITNIISIIAEYCDNKSLLNLKILNKKIYYTTQFIISKLNFSLLLYLYYYDIDINKQFNTYSWDTIYLDSNFIKYVNNIKNNIKLKKQYFSDEYKLSYEIKQLIKKDNLKFNDWLKKILKQINTFNIKSIQYNNFINAELKNINNHIDTFLKQINNVSFINSLIYTYPYSNIKILSVNKCSFNCAVFKDKILLDTLRIEGKKTNFYGIDKLYPIISKLPSLKTLYCVGNVLNLNRQLLNTNIENIVLSNCYIDYITSCTDSSCHLCIKSENRIYYKLSQLCEINYNYTNNKKKFINKANSIINLYSKIKSLYISVLLTDKYYGGDYYSAFKYDNNILELILDVNDNKNQIYANYY